ncbi:MAG TPA: RnfABCDGE type electron transport complex subunit D [Phycisphaerales bacterium]|nr:RnfABCDGE type electron transport complex subunit D [Phycisphaerales bacterium]
MGQTNKLEIRVSPSPHVSKALSTRSVMIDVLIGLAPALAAAVYYFRVHAVTLVAVCVASCAAAEWVCNRIRRRANTLGDFSAVVTGVILAFSLPPALPWWAAMVGGCVAIGIGKMVFGGLGSNVFNPAMVGRTFMAASLGTLMTTWTVPATVDPVMPKVAPQRLDARTQATPLAWSKTAIKNELGATTYNRQIFGSTVTGEVGGCLGETSAVALALGGLYLLIRRTINWRIPAGVLGAAFVFAAAAFVLDGDVVSEPSRQWLASETYVQPLFHLTSGAMLLCAFFIATDPVTMPLTGRGMWIFAVGVGILTMLIRVVGEYPEGVMYAILLMNGATPLIDRFCKVIPVGGKPGGKG